MSSTDVSIDPVVAQQMALDEYGLNPVDWSKCNDKDNKWNVDVLRNLSKLSSLSNFDLPEEIRTPSKQQLVQLATTQEEKATEEGQKEDESQQQQRQSQVSADISTEAQQVPLLPSNVQVNYRANLHNYDDVQDLLLAGGGGETEATPSSSSAVVTAKNYYTTPGKLENGRHDHNDDDPLNTKAKRCGFKELVESGHLLNLSELTLQRDPHLRNMVVAIAERRATTHTGDPSALKVLSSAQKQVRSIYHSPSTKTELRLERGMRPTTHPNRCFRDSDIISYPALERLDGLPTEIENDPAITHPPSVHDIGGETVFQRKLDLGMQGEDPDELLDYRELLTNVSGRKEAVLERIRDLSAGISPQRRMLMPPTTAFDEEASPVRQITDGE